MRRRTRAPRAGDLLPFVAPVGDFRTVWAAWLAWDETATAWESAHPEHAAEVDAVRAASHIPDAPLDVADV